MNPLNQRTHVRFILRYYMVPNLLFAFQACFRLKCTQINLLNLSNACSITHSCFLTAIHILVIKECKDLTGF